jgi:hypothetical protein
VGDALKWLGDNSGTLLTFAVTLSVIWGAKGAIALKVIESLSEANDARNKLILKGALKRLDEKADDALEFIEKAHNDIDYGTALLWRRSRDKAKRERAEEMLNRLQRPSFLDE